MTSTTTDTGATAPLAGREPDERTDGHNHSDGQVARTMHGGRCGSMKPLRIGFMLPTVGQAATPDTIKAWAIHCEEVGASSVWASDHVILPVAQETARPHGDQAAFPVPAMRDYYESFSALLWAGAVTNRIKLGSAVTVVPYRHPLLLAKMVGTISALTSNRFILGAGAGWMREEFGVLEVDFKGRDENTDAALDLIRACPGTEGVVTLQDRHSDRMLDAYVRPHPPACLPIWIGGLGPKALRRTARIGDVWFPGLGNLPPERAGELFDGIREQAGGFGRDPASIGFSMYIVLQVGGEANEAPWSDSELRGPPGRILEMFERYRDNGMTEIVVTLPGSVDRRRRALDALLDAGLVMETGEPAAREKELR